MFSLDLIVQDRYSAIHGFILKFIFDDMANIVCHEAFSGKHWPKINKIDYNSVISVTCSFSHSVSVVACEDPSSVA